MALLLLFEVDGPDARVVEVYSEANKAQKHKHPYDELIGPCHESRFIKQRLLTWFLVVLFQVGRIDDVGDHCGDHLLGHAGDCVGDGGEMGLTTVLRETEADRD